MTENKDAGIKSKESPTDEFNRVIKALALELPESVWMDVNNLWIKYQNYIQDTFIKSESKEGGISKEEALEKAHPDKSYMTPPSANYETIYKAMDIYANQFKSENKEGGISNEEIKYTPAPWFAVEYAGFWSIQKKDEYSRTDDLLNAEYCDKAEYNAELCALAPTLFQRCKEIEAERDRFEKLLHDATVILQNQATALDYYKKLAEAAEELLTLDSNDPRYSEAMVKYHDIKSNPPAK